ncbi:class A beta-lactamase-related serine hydrolase [Flaviaesturariibacter flavus]|uniref:Class A beta-lactamase-related serine hydrolase n=1 Tax=Flaviaesturariibacter flavus TaxID=2502780 RepID=A0A4R1BK06_9BACT|nr:serine hydrolase domain-containing protein [Flaviaesturariibacter flavus]TCJ17639.1 class A beta-lactamase-related serine hydrolase [Flaviaesturariibacter flavus]
MNRLPLLFATLLFFAACKKPATDDTNNRVVLTTPGTGALYFPPATGTNWDAADPRLEGWDTASLNTLAPWLQSKNTKAFIILKQGRIAYEKYFGTFTADSLWYWASAGKTATALLTGIAVKEGRVNINDRVSQYIGTGWTSAPLAKENAITVRHLLTMTSGLDDGVADDECTTPACLQYKADAGTRWAYHNGAHTKLHNVLESATGQSYNAWWTAKVKNRTGMGGVWVMSGYNEIYYSNARSMARFGLLLLNRGNWAGDALVDSSWFNAQVSSSQSLNLSYGYLTWLNGKSTAMVPQSQTVFPGPLVASAPADLFAALGKNDQKIYVSPAQSLVVIRLGESAGPAALGPSGFDNELWTRLRTILHSW